MLNGAQNRHQLKSAEILRDVLREKQRRNPSYSMRAAARDVGVTSGYLTLVLQGKRHLTFKRAVEFVQLLRIDEQTSQVFLRAVALEATKDAGCRAFLEKSLAEESSESVQTYATLELDRFRTLSEWYHIAILDLTLVQGFRPDPTWIAEELGITVAQVNTAASRLQRLGLLEIRDGQWIKTNALLAIPTTYSDRAMREFQEQMLEKAREALQSPEADDFAARDISGISMAINPARLPEAKLKIQKFRREMLEFLGTGECTELYRMNVQLFGLSKRRSRKTKEK
jgi:uncharacterized protein (TIGR02147 family)